MFSPFSSESQFLKDGSYCDRLQELNVLETEEIAESLYMLFDNLSLHDSLYMQIQKNANDSKRATFTETTAIVVKNPAMIRDSQIEGPKLGL